MSSQDSEQNEFYKFVASVQSKINVMDLYTKLTGEQFEKKDARLRAKCVWREDNNPSLSYYAAENTLTDFTNQTNEDRATYGPVQILLKCGGALSYSHALQMACDMVDMEIPEEFKKVDSKGNSVAKDYYYAGPKLKEIWDLCKANLHSMILDHTKRPIHLTTFFESRNIPMNYDFIKAINIGMFPSVEEIRPIVKDTNLAKQGKGRELDIFGDDFANNAIIFPLYTINGALGGLRARKLNEKGFKQWIPIPGTQCFYNMNNFRNRPHGHRIMLCESELGVVAYAIGVYNEFKTSENLEQEITNALPIVYATGSKTNSVDVFQGQIQRLLYIQDNDIKNHEEVPDPLNHPLVAQCNKIANEINCNDLTVADWEKVPYATTNNFDLEDYLKYNNYSLLSLRDFPVVSFPRYCFNSIRNYLETIKDQDNKRECQIKFSFAVSDKLQNAQKQVFSEIAEKEFSLAPNTAASLRNTDRNIAYGDLSIDAVGRIVQTENDNGVIRIKPKTNFYLKISNETYYYNLQNTCTKTYTIKVMIANGKNHEDEIDAGKFFDNSEIQKFLAVLTNVTDLEFYDSAWRGKEFYNITNLMNAIPNNNTSYVFSSLGRPTEFKTIDIFNTKKFCLMPDVSVINGEVLENKNFTINIDNEDAAAPKTKFKFKKADDDEYREISSLFWNHVRHIHETVLVDTMVSIVFDSCTRDVQGTGVVENDHGFPLYLSGQSGGFKSTAALGGMCLLGDFKEQQSDFMNPNGTALSWVHQLQSTGTLTHCLDDLKVEQVKSEDFVNVIHTIYGATTKSRMDSSGTKMKGADKIRSSVIVTSEATPNDIPESIAARFLNLRIVKPDLLIANEWKTHLDIMKAPKDDGSCNFNRMSAFLPRAIAWCHERGIQPYNNSLKKWYKHYLTLLDNKANNTERPADMVARIIAAWEQLTEYCKVKEVCTPQEADQAFKNLVTFWDEKIFDQLRRIESHSSKFKIVDLLVQILKTEAIGIKTYVPNRWLDTKRMSYSGYPVRDITYPDDRGRKIVIIGIKGLLQCMNNYLEAGHHIVEDKFKVDLKEAGVIETDLQGNYVSYPVPDEGGRINENARNNSNIVIDYNSLMRLHEGFKR